MTELPTRTLAGALDALRSAASAAGLDPEAAVREGEALAAAVAESAEQAPTSTGASRPVIRIRRPFSMPHIVDDVGAPLRRCCSDSSWSIDRP